MFSDKCLGVEDESVDRVEWPRFRRCGKYETNSSGRVCEKRYGFHCVCVNE